MLSWFVPLLFIFPDIFVYGNISFRQNKVYGETIPHEIISLIIYNVIRYVTVDRRNNIENKNQQIF
jgi:hypothetical protein